MSNKVEDLVEDPKAHPEIKTARNMVDAANSGASLGGYAAINETRGKGEEGPADSDIARLAYQLFLERQTNGEEGSADGDWFRAESEIRRKDSTLNET